MSAEGSEGDLRMCTLDSTFNWGRARKDSDKMSLMLRSHELENVVLAAGSAKAITAFLKSNLGHIGRIGPDRQYSHGHLRHTRPEVNLAPAGVGCYLVDANTARLEGAKKNRF